MRDVFRTMKMPVETFAALEGMPGVRHAFLCRVPGLDVQMDREEALARLAEYHAAARVELGFPVEPLGTARQVHGNRVAVLREAVTQEARRRMGW